MFKKKKNPSSCASALCWHLLVDPPGPDLAHAIVLVVDRSGSDGRTVGAPPHEREALAVPDLPAKPRPKPNTPMHPGHTHTRRRASDCYQASGGVPPGGEPPGNGSTTGLPSMVGTHFPIRSSKCCPSRATSCSRNRGLAAAPNCTVMGAATSDCRQRKSSGGAAVAGTAGG